MRLHGLTIAFGLKRVNPARVLVPLSYGRGVGGEGSRKSASQSVLIRRAIARHLLPEGEGRGPPTKWNDP